MSATRAGLVRGRRASERAVWIVALGLCLGVPLVSRGDEVRSDDRYLLSATEDRLWLVAPEMREGRRVSRIYNRTRGRSFGPGQVLSRRVGAIVADGDSLLTFFDDGAVYRYWSDGSAPVAERVLPRQTIPLDLAAGGGRVWAIVASDIAEQLEREATSRPADTKAKEPNARVAGTEFHAGGAPLSLIAYDGHAWHAVAALPVEVTLPTKARLRPRLVAAEGRLFLFATGERGRIRAYTSAVGGGGWESAGGFAVPRLAALWAVEVNHRPVVVTAAEVEAGREQAGAWRRGSEGEAWRKAALRLSVVAEGEGAGVVRYEAAGGFNQHIAILGRGAAGDVVVRFGRLGDTPVEPSISISRIIGGRAVREQIDNMIQGGALVLLIVILTGLFAFRRGATVRPVPLPPGYAPALRGQRLLAWFVDFAPFALISAQKLGVSWREGLAALGRWGVTPSAETLLPEDRILYWWGLTVLGYTAYALTMELWTGRTVGKVLFGERLLSERGTPPRAWQVIVRNAVRPIELLPQFWVFAMLVLVSRNRQRMGDIFAWTVVVRGRRLGPEVPRGGGGSGSRELGGGVDEHHGGDKKGRT